MAHASDLPCDGDGVCFACKGSPPEEEKLVCSTCGTPWHVPCLSNPPSSLSALPHWQCPDCSPPESGDRHLAPARLLGAPSELIAAVRAIEADGSLTDKEKARRRQELMSAGTPRNVAGEKQRSRKNDLLGLMDGSLICCFCRELPERPVTTPCGHNFCLNCFQKWIANGKRNCAKCRSAIPAHMASQPRINSALVAAIRVAKTAKSVTFGAEFPPKVYHFIHNQDRPDKAFTTERAQRAGKANACSGKIFVTVPPDHFGPILAENDPIRNQGVLVGESWEDRMECRQWGAHLPHVAGIAGQSYYGAQSVALSGGYQDDEDHGEWFLYTGSGGRDLSGNKRTNKEQSFDQQFNKMNEALRVSCIKGYPVRVVRSHKEKRSSYAPEAGVRYDGIYRIEKCWRKVGLQGFKVCRYLFVRCDNEPAPWTSDEHGDRPRPLPNVKELKDAIDITERKGSPAWDYVEKDGWRWAMPPPTSRKKVATSNPEDQKRARQAIRRANNTSARQKLLKELSCLLCQKVMNLPLTTPCAHNFCKSCLEGVFTGQTFVRERTRVGGRSLRVQKNVMKCPCCPNDISDFLQNAQVNRELMDVIENLKQQTVENAESSEDEINCTAGKPDPVDEETIVGPRMLETSDEVIQTTQITANKNLMNEENVESSENEINGTAGKPDSVDEEILVGQRMQTSNEAIQTTNDCKHSPAHKQNGIMLGSESNGPFTQNDKRPQSFNKDNQIYEGGSKQSVICRRKKINAEKKHGNESDGTVLGSVPNGTCKQNAKTAQSFNEDNLISAGGSKQSAACKRKKITDQHMVADSNKSDDYGTKNTETKDRSGKNCDIRMKESKRPITRSQKKLASLSKGNQPSKQDCKNSNSVDLDCRNGQVQSIDSKQPVNYKSKKRGNGKAKSSKKSNEDDRDDDEMANRRGEDLRIPQGKKTVMYKNKTKYIKKERNNVDELNSENLTLLDEDNIVCARAENKHPKTLTRRPLTRSCSAKMGQELSLKSKESPDVGKAMNSKGAKGAKKSKTIDCTDVKKDHQTPESKQPNTFVRKRPLTRSCTSKAKESNAKRSKTSGESSEKW